MVITLILCLIRRFKMEKIKLREEKLDFIFSSLKKKDYKKDAVVLISYGIDKAEIINKMNEYNITKKINLLGINSNNNDKKKVYKKMLKIIKENKDSKYSLFWELSDDHEKIKGLKNIKRIKEIYFFKLRKQYFFIISSVIIFCISVHKISIYIQ